MALSNFEKYIAQWAVGLCGSINISWARFKIKNKYVILGIAFTDYMTEFKNHLHKFLLEDFPKLGEKVLVILIEEDGEHG